MMRLFHVVRHGHHLRLQSGFEKRSRTRERRKEGRSIDCESSACKSSSYFPLYRTISILGYPFQLNKKTYVCDQSFAFNDTNRSN